MWGRRSRWLSEHDWMGWESGGLEGLLAVYENARRDQSCVTEGAKSQEMPLLKKAGKHEERGWCMVTWFKVEGKEKDLEVGRGLTRTPPSPPGLVCDNFEWKAATMWGGDRAASSGKCQSLSEQEGERSIWGLDWGYRELCCEWSTNSRRRSGRVSGVGNRWESLVVIGMWGGGWVTWETERKGRSTKHLAWGLQRHELSINVLF